MESWPPTARYPAKDPTFGHVSKSDAYVLRPGFVQPTRGVTNRMRSVRWMYALTAPVFPFLQKTLGRWVTSTDLLAAMLQLAVKGSENKILNTGELNALTGRAS